MKDKASKIKIGILGFGHMGQAIFRILKNHFDYRFYIHSLKVNKVAGAVYTNSFQELTEKTDILFLCIKPQEFYQLGKISALNKKIIIVSIMAGVKIKNIRKIIPAQKIVRSMPNLPLQIGMGVTGWYYNPDSLNPKEKKLIDNIFNCFGVSLQLKKESQLNAITALSGSGPAYIFLFFNAIKQAAIKLGFTEKQAWKITFSTFAGSLQYLSSEKEKNLDKLILKIKSKKGTTEAALKIIKEPKFYKLWEQAIGKACDRAKEISSYELK